MNFIANYDEYYNGRRGESSGGELRKWDRHNCKWSPEKVDIPVMSRQRPTTDEVLSTEREYVTLPPIKSRQNVRALQANKQQEQPAGRNDQFTRSILSLKRSPFGARQEPNPIIYWE